METQQSARQCAVVGHVQGGSGRLRDWPKRASASLSCSHASCWRGRAARLSTDAGKETLHAVPGAMPCRAPTFALLVPQRATSHTRDLVRDGRLAIAVFLLSLRRHSELAAADPRFVHQNGIGRL